MDHLEDDKRLCRLDWARELGFTGAQYEEALKMVDSPDNENQLLVALIDVSERNKLPSLSSMPTSNSVIKQNRLSDGAKSKTGLTSSTQLNQSASSSNRLTLDGAGSNTPSCYSSITSFPTSSSDQSLDQTTNDNIQRPFSTLKKIYIDGSNVARTHGRDASFSWRGIKECVDWFYGRNHHVKVFVPAERFFTTTNYDVNIIKQLDELDVLIRTPTGCNDDLFIIEAAKLNNGIIVSNDFYRQEKRFNEELQRFIRLNRLPFVFVDDQFIPAQDPLGRAGPTLDEFLSESPCSDRFNGFSMSNRQHSKSYRNKSLQKSSISSSYHLKNSFSHRTIHHSNYLNAYHSVPVNYNRSLQEACNLSVDEQHGNQLLPSTMQKQQVRRAANYSNHNHQQQTKESDIIKYSQQHRCYNVHKSFLYRTKSDNV